MVAAAIIGTWAAKIQRQPNVWMTGPPMATPMTGPPAPTRDQKPMALTLSPRSKTEKMRAIEAAPVAAPSMPPKARTAISAVAVGAMALRAAATMAPAMP